MDEIRTDRIDFTTTSDGRVIITKMYRSEDKRRDIAHSSETKPAGFDLNEALAWCEANGFTVLRWYNGARAFKGKPWAVRRNWEILRLRAQLDDLWLQEFNENPGRRHPVEQLQEMDLAFAG
jgi:hypothetical protein